MPPPGFRNRRLGYSKIAPRINVARPALLYVFTGKPNRAQIFMRCAILVVALCMSGPVLLRWWRALATVP
jgi:hypothetical protein